MRACAAIGAGWFLLATAAAVPAGAAPAVTTFGASADVHISSAAPRHDYHRSRRLVLRAKPIGRAFVRFDVPRLTGPVTRASLRLRALRGSREGFEVRALASRWPRRLTYRHAPRLGPRIAASGPFAAGRWVTVDVTRAIRRAGALAFAMTTRSSAPILLASREAGPRSAPSLEIAFDVGAELTLPSIDEDPLVAPVVPSPASVEAPSIAGRAWEKRMLSATSGMWSGAPRGFAYQWRRCDVNGGSCTDIAGAAAPTYAVDSQDLGRTVRVAVTASNVGGSTTAISDETDVVTKAPPSPTVKSSPSISGREEEGQALAVRPGKWKGAEPIEFAYQWRRCDKRGDRCVDIAGASGTTYALTAQDVGATLRVAVTASNVAASTTVVTDDTDTVTAPPPPSTVGAVGIWHMDEFGGDTMLDSSGLRNNGKLRDIVLNQAGVVGSGYYFNGRSAIVSVASNDSLNPGVRDFSWSLNLRFTSKPSGSVDSWDPMRKGYGDSSGGDFKMEVEPSGEISCYFKGAVGSGRVSNNRDLADGFWHSVTCARSGGSIRLDVDGRTFSNSASIGWIWNSAPLVIGARTSGMEFFNGYIDEARMTIY